MRQGKPLLYALALSLLLHLSLLLGPRIELPHWTPEPPLTVAIQTPPPPIAAAPTPRPPRRRSATPAPIPAPAAALITPSAEPLPLPPPAPPPVVQTPEPVAPPAVPTPPVDPRPDFPAHIELVYSVYRGEQGLLLGKTTHTWHVVNNQYLLTSTTEATGLFALFFRGRYIMTSRGELTPNGLKPLSFWIQRGQSAERTEYANFDWAAKTLQYGKSDDLHQAPLADGTQDQLSAMYQLALTAPHTGRVTVALTTGRKLNQYEYRVVGEETIDTPLGKFKTEHIASVKNEQEGDTGDIWLAIDQHYLPVRFKLTTRNGEILDHLISELHMP
jgi:hypothetical protein